MYEKEIQKEIKLCFQIYFSKTLAKCYYRWPFGATEILYSKLINEQIIEQIDQMMIKKALNFS